jgi:2-methylisocitrate lyase-like PEP mutase family enzyme
LEEHVGRLKGVLEAGADMMFIKSLRTEEECKILVKEVAPKLVHINVPSHVRDKNHAVDKSFGLTYN